MARLSAVVREDHRHLEREFQAIFALSTDNEKRQWRDKFALEIARHCITERLVFLDMLRTLPDGKILSETIQRDHNSIRTKMNKLNVMSPDDVNFAPELEALWVDLSGHNSDAKDNGITQLEKTLTESEVEKLADKYVQAGKTVLAQTGGDGANPMVAEEIKAFLMAPASSLKDLDPVLRDS